MSQFIPKIKCFYENYTLSGRTGQLTNKIRSYINDSSDYHSDRKGIKIFLNLIQNIFERLYFSLRLHKIPMFNPESKIKIIFNSIIVTYSLFYLFLISLQVFFSANFGHTTHLLHQIAMGCWITEMVLEMNTSCYHNNIFITDRKIIVKIYLKEYFFFEILPLIFEGRQSENLIVNILLHLPLLLKIKGMMINLEKLEFYILQLLEKQHFFQLFKLIMQMLLLSHIVACLWNCALQSEIKFFSEQNTWIDSSHIIDGQWWKTYLYAQYWAFTTMKNVGTAPNTVEELAFTSFCMVLSCIAFGYLLNAIGLILADITKDQEEYKKDLNILNSYMKRKNITLGLKRRANISLRKFYEKQRREKFSTEKEILNKLNSQLVYEVIEQSSKKLLHNFPFFYNIFSNETIKKLYLIMEEVILAPSQIVYDQNKYSSDTYYIYLIVKGSVLLYEEPASSHEEKINDSQGNNYTQKEINNSPSQKFQKEEIQINNSNITGYQKKKITVLTQGMSFGTLGFFTGKEQILSAQSNHYSTVIRIERSKFLKILIENQYDYEKFMEIKDKIMFDSNFNDLNLYCFACNCKDHLIIGCNKIHFNKNSKHMIYKYNSSIPQERNKVSRSNNQAFNTFLNCKIVKQMAILFQNNNLISEDSEENEFFYDDQDEEDEFPSDNNLFNSYDAEIKNQSNVKSSEMQDMKSNQHILDEEKNQIGNCESELSCFDKQFMSFQKQESQDITISQKYEISELNHLVERDGVKFLSDKTDSFHQRAHKPSKLSHCTEINEQNEEEGKEKGENLKKSLLKQKKHSISKKSHCLVSEAYEQNEEQKEKGESFQKSLIKQKRRSIRKSKLFELFGQGGNNDEKNNRLQVDCLNDFERNLVQSFFNQNLLLNLINSNSYVNPQFSQQVNSEIKDLQEKIDQFKLSREKIKPFLMNQNSFGNYYQNNHSSPLLINNQGRNVQMISSQLAKQNLQSQNFCQYNLSINSSPDNTSLKIQQSVKPNSQNFNPITINTQTNNEILNSNLAHLITLNTQTIKVPFQDQEIQQLEQQYFVWKMDIFKNFIFYYPHYNLPNVIKKYNSTILKKKKLKKKVKTSIFHDQRNKQKDQL